MRLINVKARNLEEYYGRDITRYAFSRIGGKSRGYIL